MRAKMDLLEAAHGLLCNKPTDGMSAEESEEWHSAFRKWTSRYEALLTVDASKRENKRTQIITEYILDEEKDEAEKARVIRERR